MSTTKRIFAAGVAVMSVFLVHQHQSGRNGGLVPQPLYWLIFLKIHPRSADTSATVR